MKKEKLIEELRLAIIDKRMLHTVNIGAVKIGDEFIILKNRPAYEFKEEDAIFYNEVHHYHDRSYRYRELFAKTVVYDIALFNMRGKEAIAEYLLDKRIDKSKE